MVIPSAFNLHFVFIDQIFVGICRMENARQIQFNRWFENIFVMIKTTIKKLICFQIWPLKEIIKLDFFTRAWYEKLFKNFNIFFVLMKQYLNYKNAFQT